MIDNDPKVAAESIRTGFRVSPYVPGAQGTAVGTFLAGESPLGAVAPVRETRFVEATGKSFNTVYPNDFGFWELVNELVQQEPADASDPDLLGLLASVGIVHGKPFEPDARMREILEEAVVVGNATARTATFAARPRRVSPSTRTRRGRARSSSVATSSSIRRRRSPRTAWSRPRATGPASSIPAPTSSIWPPASHRRCACASPVSARSTSTRCATAKASTSTAPAISPHASARHSREPVLVLILYDRQTRSMLQTEQHLPRLGSQSGNRRDEPRWLDRHLLRADSSQR